MKCIEGGRERGREESVICLSTLASWKKSFSLIKHSSLGGHLFLREDFTGFGLWGFFVFVFNRTNRI